MEKQIENNPVLTQGHFEETLVSEIKKIPNKISFKIGEVSQLLDIKAHVLRYWEMEFKTFGPKKMDNGQRLYLKKDVEIALLIKKLLYRDGFSVRGAKKILADLKRENRQHKKKSFTQEVLLKKITQMQHSISVIKDLIK